MNVSIQPNKLAGIIDAIPSKSYAHRILIASALCKAPTRINITKLSDDIVATMNCLRALGAKMDVHDDHIVLTPNITDIDCHTFDCNESGTTLRLLLPLSVQLCNKAQFLGRGRLMQRPLSPLKEMLEEKGVSIIPQDNSITVTGNITAGDYEIPGNVSSQFISGMLFTLPLLSGDSTLTVTCDYQSKGYVDMTISVLKLFGINIEQDGNVYKIKGDQEYVSPAEVTVEGDWSNSAFWLCASAISSDIDVKGLNVSSYHNDKKVLDILELFGANVINNDNSIKVTSIPQSDKLHTVDSADIPDLIPILAVTAACTGTNVRFDHISRLRLKESDRVKAICDMVSSLGAIAEATEDTITITGTNNVQGCTQNSFNDHRIVMCLAVASTVANGNIIITDAHAVNKSYPTFFDDMAKLGGKINVIDN